MDQARECVMKLMAVAGAHEAATAALASETDIAPPSGKGRVVIVLSGIDGPGPVQDFGNKVAQLGYFTVLVDGNAILSEDRQGGTRLTQVIAKAQALPNALPGKVAVIGFAAGGGGALAYAEAQPNTVASVIAYDPVTAFVAKVGGMKAFVSNFKGAAAGLRGCAGQIQGLLPAGDYSRHAGNSEGAQQADGADRLPQRRPQFHFCRRSDLSRRRYRRRLDAHRRCAASGVRRRSHALICTAVFSNARSGRHG